MASINLLKIFLQFTTFKLFNIGLIFSLGSSGRNDRVRNCLICTIHLKFNDDMLEAKA